MKTAKVGVLNSSDTSETTRNTAWADKREAMDSQIPSLRKLLTGFCIGQVIMVTVTAATLGVFVNSNVSILL